MTIQERSRWYAELEQEKVEKNIKGEYQECIRLLNRFFGLIYDESCGPCVEKNMVGCCVMSPANIPHKIKEWAKEEGIEGNDFTNDCPYWRKENGCAISALKPPVCASFICNLENHINLKYKINYDESSIKHTLLDIMDGRRLDSVKEFKDYIQSMIETVRKFKNPAIFI